MTNKKNNKAVNNETKVMCPVCGSEFAIGDHEHKVTDGIAIGKDSGLGTVVLPVSKRGDALKAAGIDTTKYFSIELPTGGTKMMRLNDDGVPVAVADDDPIAQAIIGGGTVPNRNLFRRWVMSQMFRGLSQKHWRTGKPISFTTWINNHGYPYQWEMLIDELHTQTKLYGRDPENFHARNRWFDNAVAVAMANDYIRQLRNDAQNRPHHKCKGVPYVTVGGKHYFLSDIEKKLLGPLWKLHQQIADAKTPQALEDAVRRFWEAAPVKQWSYEQCCEWKDAYKGAGAYYTMQNLLRFHGCAFPKDNDFFDSRRSKLDMLETAAETYSYGDGWRLLGLLKQMIEYNGIDIEAKRKEWQKAKKCKH